MTDYYLPPTAQAMEWELRSNVARFSSPMGGVTRTLERVGARWAATFRWDVLVDRQASQLKQFLSLMRGGANRFWCYDPSYVMRGSFPTSEILTNQESSSAFGSWSAGSEASLSVTDAALRVRRTANTGGGNAYAQHPVTFVQYAPYAFRGLISAIRGAAVPGVTASGTGFSAVAYDTGSTPALRRMWGTSTATSGTFFLDNVGASVSVAGDYYDVPYASASRCALVDNGPNALLRSDEIDNAAWTKNACSATAAAATGPDGTTGADAIVENSSLAFHFISQSGTRSAVAEELYVAGYFKRGAGNNRDIRMYVGNSIASDYSQADFNLSAGTTSNATNTGGNSGVRSFIADAGNGWWYCCVVAKTISGTSVSAEVDLLNAGSSSYTGNGTSSVYAWRLCAGRSTTPSRGSQTTSSANASGTAQTGSGVYLRGLPASTNGLALQGDWAEFITPTYSELKRITAPLDSNAAGLGYLQFEPTFRQSPAEGAAVVFYKPMVRMLLDDSTVKMQHMPGLGGGYQSCSFTAVEDVAV